MKSATLARLAALLAFAAVGTVAPGCGSGGGSTPAVCGLPGSLIALALEGGSAPDTGGGSYGAIPAQVDASAADGGWAAFSADVTGGSVTKGLFAAVPGGAVRLVYAKGETVQPPAAGQIDDFQRVFVTSGGVIVALVSITGGDAFGLVTARIDGTGTVVEKHTAIASGDTLPGSTAQGLLSPPGAVTAIDANLIQVDDQGSTIFAATGANGPHGIYRVDRVGIAVEWLAQSGDVVPDLPLSFQLTTAFDNLAIDGDGVLIAFTCTNNTNGNGGILVTNGTTTAVVAKDSDVAPGTGGRTFTDVSNGVLAVNEVFPNGVVFWQAGLSGAAPSTGVFYKLVAPAAGAVTALAVPGRAVPGAGPLAAISTLRMLEVENDSPVVTVEADIVSGDTFRIYFSIPSPGALNEIWRQGEIAPDAGGVAAFTLTHPSTTLAHRSVTDRGGSPAFTAVLSDATTGVWWAIRNCNFFKVILEGEAAPGTVGGSFASFSTPSTLTTAADNLVFRSAITGGTNPSGLFRQH